MCEVRIVQCYIFILSDQRSLGNDQITDTASVHQTYSFAGRMVSAFRRLETVGHAAQFLEMI